MDGEPQWLENTKNIKTTQNKKEIDTFDLVNVLLKLLKQQTFDLKIL